MAGHQHSAPARAIHYQAITTKFHGPTNSRGARILARAAAGKLTHHWDYGMNQQSNHAAAAKALAEKLEWNGAWVSGGMPDATGDVFVLASSQPVGFVPAFIVGKPLAGRFTECVKVDVDAFSDGRMTKLFKALNMYECMEGDSWWLDDTNHDGIRGIGQAYFDLFADQRAAAVAKSEG